MNTQLNDDQIDKILEKVTTGVVLPHIDYLHGRLDRAELTEQYAQFFQEIRELSEDLGFGPEK